MRITRTPAIDLTGALEDTPSSADTIRKAGTLTVTATGVEGLYTVSLDSARGGHQVHLGRNSALCDCEAARHDRVCSHVLAVVAHTGWTPPERPKVTIPEDPFEGLV